MTSPRNVKSNRFLAESVVSSLVWPYCCVFGTWLPQRGFTLTLLWWEVTFERGRVVSLWWLHLHLPAEMLQGDSDLPPLSLGWIQ